MKPQLPVRIDERPRCAEGFTLIEMLIVIAIISILATMLVPSLHRGRDITRSAKCLNNLRQLATVAHAYANIYDGHYPIAYYHIGRVSYAWDFNTMSDFRTNPPTASVEPGILWQGTSAEEIHQCPSFTGAHNWLADPYTGYNYNTSYIGHGSGEAIVEPARVSAVANPPGTALFGDGEYRSGANKFMRAPWANPGDAGFSGRFAGTQGYRHLDKTNVAFCDGHAASWSQRYTDTYPADRANIAPGTGFLSPDNSLYDLE